MQLPTQDKALDKELTWLYEITHYGKQFLSPRIREQITKTFETHGYHKGLPTSIEEALNSGDGTYRL